MRSYGCLFCLDVPLTAALELLLKILHQHIRLIDNLKLLPAAGKLHMDTINDFIQLADKCLSALYYLTSIGHKL